MRHTACTRMAEKRIDVKVLQYIMGHAHIDVTMDAYNHVSEASRNVEWCAMFMLISVSLIYALVLFLSNYLLYRYEKRE